MKRLLAYLFIVLGLGLVFSANGNADSGPGYCVEGLTNTFYYDDGDKKYFKKGLYPVFKLKNRTKGRTCIKKEFISKARYPSQYKNLKKDVGVFKTHKSIPLNKIISSIQGTHVFDEYNRIYETQIAKAEPSQTQEVKNIDLDEYYTVMVSGPGPKSLDGKKFYYFASNKDLWKAIKIALEKCENTIKDLPNKQSYIQYCYDGYYFYKGNYYSKNKYSDNGVLLIKGNLIQNINPLYKRNFEKALNDFKNEKTQIAKAEPSQTQEVTNLNNLQFCSNYVNATRYRVQKRGKYPCEKEYKIEEFVYLFLHRTTIDNPTEVKLMNNLNTLYSEFKRENLDINIIDNIVKKNLKLKNYLNLIKTNKTQIAKTEPSQTQEVAGFGSEPNAEMRCPGSPSKDSAVWKRWSICQGTFRDDANKWYTAWFPFYYRNYYGANNPNAPRKKTLVRYDGTNFYYEGSEQETQIAEIKPEDKPAEVAETTQEEFKPEDKDIDNDPPVIQIAEAITVDSQAYTLKGKVKDKSKIYLTIDGRQVQVKKGKFTVDRFNIDPGEVEEIKIVAIDKWNNKTEKTIKVTIDLKSTELARSFEDLKPNNVKVKKDKNKIAIIIGIEKYVNLENLDAPFANRDAKAFRTYATRALGVKSSNIKLLVDDKAARPQILEAFKIWLPRIAADGGKDIYIFFSGHGLASDDGEDLYILPQNGYANLLDDTAITRVELISLIQKVNPKSVTMFFDTCYSGQTREERMLVASLKPIRIVAEEQDTPDNFTVFSASNFDQTSGTIKEAKQGMFSYYLMKGLEGKADTNRDKKITNGELIAYLKTNVSKEAFTQNREQDPMLSGDPDKVLMSYR